MKAASSSQPAAWACSSVARPAAWWATGDGARSTYATKATAESAASSKRRCASALVGCTVAHSSVEPAREHVHWQSADAWRAISAQARNTLSGVGPATLVGPSTPLRGSVMRAPVAACVAFTITPCAPITKPRFSASRCTVTRSSSEACCAEACCCAGPRPRPRGRPSLIGDGLRPRRLGAYRRRRTRLQRALNV